MWNTDAVASHAVLWKPKITTSNKKAEVNLGCFCSSLPGILHLLQESSALEHSSLMNILGDEKRKNPERPSAKKDACVSSTSRVPQSDFDHSFLLLSPTFHSQSHQRAEFPHRVISLPPLPFQEWYLHSCSYCILCQCEESCKMQQLCRFHASAEKKEINDLI